MIEMALKGASEKIEKLRKQIIESENAFYDIIKTCYASM
jgi:hypothetical protein